MQRKPNHTCRICGTAYYACGDCDKRQSWRSFCDTPEHYQVFQVLLMYARHMIGAPEAVDMLTNIGIDPDNLIGFVPQKVAEIRAIFAAAQPEVVEEDPVTENICETDVRKTRSKSRRSDA